MDPSHIQLPKRLYNNSIICGVPILSAWPKGKGPDPSGILSPPADNPDVCKIHNIAKIKVDLKPKSAGSYNFILSCTIQYKDGTEKLYVLRVPYIPDIKDTTALDELKQNAQNKFNNYAQHAGHPHILPATLVYLYFKHKKNNVLLPGEIMPMAIPITEIYEMVLNWNVIHHDGILLFLQAMLPRLNITAQQANKEKLVLLTLLSWCKILLNRNGKTIDWGDASLNNLVTLNHIIKIIDFEEKPRGEPAFGSTTLPVLHNFLQHSKPDETVMADEISFDPFADYELNSWSPCYDFALGFYQIISILSDRDISTLRTPDSYCIAMLLFQKQYAIYEGKKNNTCMTYLVYSILKQARGDTKYPHSFWLLAAITTLIIDDKNFDQTQKNTLTQLFQLQQIQLEEVTFFIENYLERFIADTINDTHKSRAQAAKVCLQQGLQQAIRKQDLVRELNSRETKQQERPTKSQVNKIQEENWFDDKGINDKKLSSPLISPTNITGAADSLFSGNSATPPPLFSPPPPAAIRPFPFLPRTAISSPTTPSCHR